MHLSFVFHLLFISLITASSTPTPPSIIITQPSVGTIWNAGSQVVIKWQPTNPSVPLPTSALQFQLLYGSPTGTQQSLGTLVTAPKASDGVVKFTLQGNIPQSNQYMVRAVGGSGFGGGNSPLFAIMNGLVSGGVDPNNVPKIVEARPLDNGLNATGGAHQKGVPVMALSAIGVVAAWAVF